VISGQPANVKRVTRTTKTKELAEKKKGCGKIIVPTAECDVSSKNPVGNTIPTLPSHADGSKLNPKGSSPGYTTVTLSNGVTTSAIFNGKGLTVTSTSPGTITVSNGTNSVTMPGGSMNLSGAVSVQAGAGVQLVRHPNGDVTVAANPTTAGAPAKPTAGANNGPPGVTFTDDLKAVGKSGAAGPTLTAIGVATVWLGLGGAAIGSVVGKPLDFANPLTTESNGSKGSFRAINQLASPHACDRSSVARFCQRISGVVLKYFECSMSA
jgi:hypothetical protein